ncbi:hypothetical protein HYPSUDRAFT_204504 [Hypholoma sublateritium FD-334 SS-4]|uniref:Uncharacterized protein n=1 Tax=Hypholoma sublateritium (strain FD-334 SS-4) TaxID=945553 RepID=A0A0D2PHV3_HYPSF|nr:hypothetical protein HYPSUDRAFT_204504 [Hypholoma sublateritium FD-334 SS-4]
MLQRARSFLNAVPGPAPSTAHESESDNQPWIVFFADRARRATGHIPTKKPPMKVYHWEKDDNGQWQRTAVLKVLRNETLDEYGHNQKVFDERSNEWDCCTDMGELDAAERQALYEEDDPILPIGRGPLPSVPDNLVSSPVLLQVSRPSPPPFMHDNSVNPSFLPSSAPAPADIDSETDHPIASSEEFAAYLPEQHSPADVLRLFFGFVAPPPSVRLHLPDPTEHQVKDLALGVGCANLDLLASYVKTSAGRYAANFFWSLSQSPWIPPSNVLFDLARGNSQSIQHRRRMRFLRQLPGDIYLFDFGKEATVEWHICVSDISLALLIIRLDDNLCDYDIARALLNQGSPFCTVMDSVPFPIVPCPPGISRVRLSSYQFSAEDYKTYRRDSAELLRSPRVARQALMRGGILWRLAMEHASFQDVLAGPTIVATIQHRCRSFVGGADRFFIDDVLTMNEVEVICGVYCVYTGQGIQTAKKSWWPLPDLWDMLACQPFWQERSESWFERRLEELESGRGVPLTATQWRSRSKQNSVVCRAIINNTEVSKAFLKDLQLPL